MQGPRFQSFVLFAEMRTGSNLLEEILNSVPGLACHGEAFNPHFVGSEGCDELLGVSLSDRERDPQRLLHAIRDRQGLNGFRFFHDHDTRVLETVLNDPTCAKVVLTRSPIDSYLSLKIARGTGQWKLTDPKHRKTAPAQINVPEFTARLDAIQAFSRRLLHALQVTGQAAFTLSYDDLGDTDVLNGLLAFFGLDGRLNTIDTRLIPQNPGSADDKVTDPGALEEIARVLAKSELAAPVWPEPRRAPGVRGFLVARGAPVLFLPVAGGPNAQIEAWLNSLGKGGSDRISDRGALRDWMRGHPGFVSLSVLRHPAPRAFAAWLALAEATAQLKTSLLRLHGVEAPDPDAPTARGFGTFLRFLRENLEGRTSMGTGPLWATQSSHLAAIDTVVFPEIVLRETRLRADLPQVAERLGVTANALPGPDGVEAKLARLWSPDLEKLCRSAYRRDYVDFGFGPWAPSQAA
jgi:hypothetical protein